jgi:WD40 repeat protein
MLKPIANLRSVLNRLRETLFKGLFRARFRYDVFISYSHSDAREYAANLKKQLSSLDFSCFIDEEESPPGLSLRPTLESALEKSAILVLLATERALTRPYISLEIEKFVPTRRTIVPINIAGALTRNDEEALTKAPWNIINERNLVWIDETDEAFAKKNPSPPVADGIDKLFKYTRRNARVRTEIATVAAMVLLAAVVAGYQIKVKGGEALLQAERARAATLEADNQQALATKATKEAESQRSMAATAAEETQKQLKIAGDAKKEAERQQELARKATAEANKQLAVANAAKNEADRQQERSRNLSYDADISLAQRAFDEGSLPRVVELLDSCKPDSTKQKDLRGFEWYYLSRLVHRELFSLHKLMLPDGLTPAADVDSVVFASKGNLLAAGQYGLVTVWDMASRNKVATLQGPDRSEQYGERLYLAFSHDGKLLAIADKEAGLKVWNPRSNAQPLWLKQGELYGSINQLAFSADDRTLITGGEATTFWDISSGRKQVIDEGDLLTVEPNGKTIALYSSSEQQLKLLDVASTKNMGTVKAPGISGQLVPVALSPDGKLVAVLEVYGQRQATNGRLHLWNLQSGETQQIGDFEDASVLFSPDSKTLVVGSKDGFVRLWDVTSKTEQARFYGNTGRVYAMSFQLDGTILAAGIGYDSIEVWDATPKAELVKTSGPGVAVEQLSFSPDSQFVAVGDSLGGVTIWNAGIQSPVAELGRIANGITSVAFSSDGKTVSFRSGKDTLKLWNLDVKEVVDTVKGIESHSNIVGTFAETTVLISPDGDMIAAVVDADTIKFWDVRSRKESGALKGISGHNRLLAFSPDHRFLLTTNELTTNSYDSVKLWNVSKQEEIVTLKWSDVSSAVFSPKSNFLACIFGAGKGFVVWDLHTQSEVYALGKDLSYRTGPRFGPIAFSPDEKSVAIVSGKADNQPSVVNLWSMTERNQFAILKGHRDSITSISFSPDGKTIATGSNDGTVKLWSATTYQQLISTLTPQQTRAIGSVLFSPDGKTLAVGDYEGTLRFLYAGSRWR